METPKISVVVPTYGRPAYLVDCLDALARLDYPRDRFEVIVVDDGSPQPVDHIVKPYLATLPLTLLRRKNGGPGAARNTAIGRASGEFVAFTDDDCAPAPDWLRVLAARFCADADVAVGGSVVNTLVDNPYSQTTDSLFRYLYHRLDSSGAAGIFFTTSNLAFPLAPLRQLGGFDESFRTGEDRELCHRWIRSGHRVVFAPESCVAHTHPLTLTDFCRVHFSYGAGSRQFHCKARNDGAPIHFWPVTFYLGLLLHPFTRTNPLRALIESSLLALAQIANAAGFARGCSAFGKRDETKRRIHQSNRQRLLAPLSRKPATAATLRSHSRGAAGESL